MCGTNVCAPSKFSCRSCRGFCASSRKISEIRKHILTILGSFETPTPPVGDDSDRINQRKRSLTTKSGDMSSDLDSDKMSLDDVTLQNNQRRLRKKSKKNQKDSQKKLNIQHKDIPGEVQFTVPTTNQFSSLAGLENEVRVTRKSSAIKKVRIPPIIVPPPATKNTIKAALCTLKINEYFIKHASIGLYIHVNTLDHHKTVREYFKNRKISFFSHDLPEDKVVKVVLSGLDQMETSKLEDELKVLGFSPVDIKTIVPKQSRYTNHVNFIVYFKRDSVDLKALYNVKAIFHTIVRWEPYRSSRTSPTQCRRCQRPGHGTRHCEMPPRCMYCAQNHLSNVCPCIKEAYEEAKTASGQEMPTTLQAPTSFKLVCCNCQGPHAASDPECPVKLKYQEIQRRLSTRNRRPLQKDFVRRLEDFPSTLPPVSSSTAPTRTRRPLYSQVVTTPTKTTTQINSIAFENSTSNDCSGDLFSFEELNSLLQEMMSSLSKCRNKSDQFQVISNLGIKYVYNGRK